MENLVTSLMDFARVVLLVIGGGVGLVKFVKGKSDENPRESNEGLLTLAVSGVLCSVTFAVQAIFKT